nr:integrase, catalytic region, zinc finger, CCHC-type, peptidase aspartic, catalytic [Tanacetum cinerariifolium]GEZ77994.1 integrase, catalytic region, zinc finger, CCHC-type, peptidase aspartic, catalytic [Tanacetum cinerariifolium]
MIKNLLWLLKMMKHQRKRRLINSWLKFLYHSRKSTNLPTTTFKLHQTPVKQIRIILQGLTEALRMKIKGLELEAHYMYMAQIQEVSPDAADSGPIFDSEPVRKVSNDDHYNVFSIKSEHHEQSKSVEDTYPTEQDAHNVIIDSLDMSCDREQLDQNDDDNDLANEHELLVSLIEKLKCEIDDSKNRNKFLETSNKVLVEKLKGSRGTDLYSITLQDTNSPNPICLMSKSTSSQAWLWHRRLSHLNFDTINLLSKNEIMVGLPKLKF